MKHCDHLKDSTMSHCPVCLSSQDRSSPLFFLDNPFEKEEETIVITKKQLIEVADKVKKQTIQECIDLSDKAELEYPTEFNEWRAFKGFRNALRDKLKEIK